MHGYLEALGRTLENGSPVIHHHDIPRAGSAFIVSMVGSRGARDHIRSFLNDRGFAEGENCIFAA